MFLPCIVRIQLMRKQIVPLVVHDTEHLTIPGFVTESIPLRFFLELIKLKFKKTLTEFNLVTIPEQTAIGGRYLKPGTTRLWLQMLQRPSYAYS